MIRQFIRSTDQCFLISLDVVHATSFEVFEFTGRLLAKRRANKERKREEEELLLSATAGAIEFLGAFDGKWKNEN